VIVSEFIENGGTLFEQRRLITCKGRWRGWKVAIYHVRQRRRDGVPIWVNVGYEPVRYYGIRRLLRDRPDLQLGSIHNLDVFDHNPGVREPVRRPRRVPPKPAPVRVHVPSPRRDHHLSPAERFDLLFRPAS
jgi:hypothetical protein